VEPDETKPVAIYLPGLGGFGISAVTQFDDLANAFQFWRCALSRDDRSSFSEVVQTTVEFIENYVNETDILLIGESCGGLFALATALKLQSAESKAMRKLRGIVLVNPATSFDQTPWDLIVPFLTNLEYLDTNQSRREGLTPYSVLGSLVLSSLVPDFEQYRRIVEAIADLPELDVPPSSLQQVVDINDAAVSSFKLTQARMPPELLRHRLRWLTTGTKIVNARLHHLKGVVPTLVVAGQEDRVLPSSQEADRLVAQLDAEKLIVPRRGHFVLDENVNLTEAILYSKINPLGWKHNKTVYDPILDWKMPPRDKIDKVIEESVQPSRVAQSPVFFSTDRNGKRWKGLTKFPKVDGPLLIVGNHQFGK
jgi:pimeloyl-ACP methyl ester carboxylesterase